MNRRRFLRTTLAGLFATPLVIEAAQPSAKSPRIGVLRPGSPPDPFVEAFRRGLEELGYVEGRNITIERRWAEGRPERLPALAEDLLRLKVDVIVVGGNEAIRTVQRVTTTVPIVMPVSTDPVRIGLVASLARPGGNLTGFASQNDELPGKWIELLKELVPRASRIAVLWDPQSAGEQVEVARRVSEAMGIQLHVLKVAVMEDLDAAFAEAGKRRVEGLVVLGSPFLAAQRSRVVALAAKHRLPVVSHHKEFVVEAGGLASYGADLPDLFRRAAGTVDRILKGARPQDLPIEQPTKFELALNLRTAKTLGLTIPPSLLLRAGHVIE